MEERRSIYNLKDSISISDDELESMIAHAVKHVPSSFNSQSTRIVLLLNDNNNKFWDNTKAILKEVMGENRDFEPTEQKIDNFKHSYGTILFYEDQDVVSGLQEQMPNYYDNFAIWSTQTNAMHQFAIWTALATKGIGASLQHYNPLVDEMTSNEFNIPKSWKLIAQMPFGDIREAAGENVAEPFQLSDGTYVTQLICYDLRFPELLRYPARSGAKIAFYVAQWPMSRLHHWHSLLKARAIENNMFVIRTNSTGFDGNTEYAGHSIVINPNGDLVGELNESADILTVDLNLNEVEQQRENIPVFKSIKLDLYK
ncbi:TPA: nitroreductase family protein [Staphylococcus aureus]|nr:nitroreductase family protein [Staphylococcus aureus]